MRRRLSSLSGVAGSPATVLPPTVLLATVLLAMSLCGCEDVVLTVLTEPPPGRTSALVGDTLQLSRGVAVIIECRAHNDWDGYYGPCRQLDVEVQGTTPDGFSLDAFDVALEQEAYVQYENTADAAFTAPVARRAIALAATGEGIGSVVFHAEIDVPLTVEVVPPPEVSDEQ